MTTVVCGISFPFLDQQRQDFYLALLRGDVDWQRLEIRNPLNGQPIRFSGQSEWHNDVLAEVGHLPWVGDCEAVATRDSAQIDQEKMYRWQDAKGRWHFGDAKDIPLPSDASDVSHRYQTKASYFQFQLLHEGRELKAFTRDRIRAETRQIFAVLSQALALDHLRQVFLNIRIIDNQDDFQERLNSVAPGLKTNTGFFSTRNNEAVVWRHPKEALMYGVIRHESTHVIMAGLYGYPPVWLNEGLAEYFEQMSVMSNSKQVAVNERWLKVLRSGQLIPLKYYLSLTPSQWRGESQELMYATAWSLIHFLMSSEQGKNLLAVMMQTLAANKCQAFASLDFIEARYPGGVAQLNDHWRTWIVSAISPHYY